MRRYISLVGIAILLASCGGGLTQADIDRAVAEALAEASVTTTTTPHNSTTTVRGHDYLYGPRTVYSPPHLVGGVAGSPSSTAPPPNAPTTTRPDGPGTAGTQPSGPPPTNPTTTLPTPTTAAPAPTTTVPQVTTTAPKVDRWAFSEVKVLKSDFTGCFYEVRTKLTYNGSSPISGIYWSARVTKDGVPVMKEAFGSDFVGFMPGQTRTITSYSADVIGCELIDWETNPPLEWDTVFLTIEQEFGV